MNETEIHAVSPNAKDMWLVALRQILTIIGGILVARNVIPADVVASLVDVGVQLIIGFVAILTSVWLSMRNIKNLKVDKVEAVIAAEQKAEGYSGV